MKSVILECVFVLMAFAVLEETALARNYLNCLTKKVTIVDAPKGATSSSIEENFGFWIDEATKIVTLADGKKLDVRRFDDRWISAVNGDVSCSEAAKLDRFWLESSALIPWLGGAQRDEGIQVFGRPEGVHSQARR